MRLASIGQAPMLQCISCFCETQQRHAASDAVVTTIGCGAFQIVRK